MDKLMLIGDGDARVGMEKYMKNHFPFVGVLSRVQISY